MECCTVTSQTVSQSVRLSSVAGLQALCCLGFRAYKGLTGARAFVPPFSADDSVLGRTVYHYYVHLHTRPAWPPCRV